jgi:hypothetical protein
MRFKVGVRSKVLGCATSVVVLMWFATPASGSAGLKVKPTAINFPKTVFGVIGDQSKSFSVHISNPKNGLLVTGLSLSIAGSDAADFQQTSTTCATSLSVGEKCTVTLIFAPTGLGQRTAIFNVSDDSTPVAGTVKLKGSGIPGKLTVTPKSLNFGKVAPFAMSSKSFDLINPNKVALNITAVGTSPVDGEYTTSGCVGQVAGASGHCTVSVNFIPNSTGTRKTALLITGDQANSPSRVELVGVGFGTPATATPTPTIKPTQTPEGPTPTPTATPTASTTATPTATPTPPPVGSCVPSSSLSVLVMGKDVVAYVPKGSWSNGLTGVSLVNVEGTNVTAGVIAGLDETISSCASDPAAAPPMTVCTGFRNNIWLIPAGSSPTVTKMTTAASLTTSISMNGGLCQNCAVAMDGVHHKAVIGLSLGGEGASSSLTSAQARLWNPPSSRKRNF